VQILEYRLLEKVNEFRSESPQNLPLTAAEFGSPAQSALRSRRMVNWMSPPGNSRQLSTPLI
jgi:hypothetical protein